MRKSILTLVALVLVLAYTSTPTFGQGEGNTIILKFAGVPAGTCSFIMMGLNSANGDLYDCPAGSWVKTGTGGGGGSGTVNANSGIAGAVAFYTAAGGSTTVGPTSGLSVDAVGNMTLVQGTITVSTPAFSQTGTWNAGGVVFTNSLYNITCTAAAANSIALGLGVAGTTWQFQYAAANCASPILLLPAGTAAHPSVSVGTDGNGLYSNGANTVGIAVGGGAAITIATNDVVSFTSDINTATGRIKANTFGTQTNCAANGTAANPSVVSCTAASAGSFSCSTSASTGTCTVNTTAVTANSEIFITGRNDATTGTRLGVTCNTGISTVLPEIATVVAATSFTINLGTFASNPECFSYYIIN